MFERFVLMGVVFHGPATALNWWQLFPAFTVNRPSRAGGMAWLLQPCDTLGKPTLIFPPTTPAILRRSRSFLEIGGRKFYQGLSVVFMWPFTVLDHLMFAANAARSLLLLKFVFQPFIAATCSAPELGFVAMNLTGNHGVFSFLSLCLL